MTTLHNATIDCISLVFVNHLTFTHMTNLIINESYYNLFYIVSHNYFEYQDHIGPHEYAFHLPTD